MLSYNQYVAEYLDYIKSCLTIERFAEHRDLDVEQAQEIIKIGRAAYAWDMAKK